MIRKMIKMQYWRNDSRPAWYYTVADVTGCASRQLVVRASNCGAIHFNPTVSQVMVLNRPLTVHCFSQLGAKSNHQALQLRKIVKV